MGIIAQVDPLIPRPLPPKLGEGEVRNGEQNDGLWKFALDPLPTSPKIEKKHNFGGGAIPMTGKPRDLVTGKPRDLVTGWDMGE